MDTELENKVCAIIDGFLQLLVEKENANVYQIGNDFYSKESQMAYKILNDDELIHFMKGYPDKNSPIQIAVNGLKIIEIGGYKKHLETIQKQKEYDNYIKNIEVEKSEIDLELAKKILKEYPFTKWTARFGFLIAFCLAVLEIIKYFLHQ